MQITSRVLYQGCEEYWKHNAVLRNSTANRGLTNYHWAESTHLWPNVNTNFSKVGSQVCYIGFYKSKFIAAFASLSATSQSCSTTKSVHAQLGSPWPFVRELWWNAWVQGKPVRSARLSETTSLTGVFLHFMLIFTVARLLPGWLYNSTTKLLLSLPYVTEMVQFSALV